MGGVRENLRHLDRSARPQRRDRPRPRCRGSAALDRDRAYRPRAADRGSAARRRSRGLKLVAPWIEEKAAAELDALALTLDDQAAFAKLSRRLLEDLDLAAAEEPVEEEPEEAATRAKATRAAARIRPSRATKASPAAATSRCAARKPRTRTPKAIRRRRWRRARTRPRPATTSAKACSPRPAAATGTCRRRPTTRRSPPASMRSSRRASCATRRSSARLRAYLDQQMGGLSNVVTRLANRLQRRLMAQQARSWDFDQEEGLLDAARLARVVVNPRHALSFKVERDTEFRDTIVSLLIDNSGLDARAADRDRRDLRRHPRPDPRALRSCDRDPRLHHPRLEGRTEPRSLACRRPPAAIRAASTTFGTSSTSAPTSPTAMPGATSA